MRWWPSQSVAWEAAHGGPHPSGQAVRNFVAWVKRQRDAMGLPTFVAFPAAYDAVWVDWYCHRFAAMKPVPSASDQS